MRDDHERAVFEQLLEEVKLHEGTTLENSRGWLPKSPASSKLSFS